MQTETLKAAYRTTFQDYSKKLDILQHLTNNPVADNGRIEAALLDVEKARVAHNSARDHLARELVRPAFPSAGMEENRIRETARLLWEFAGRPEGSAERDWQQAEQLIRSASAC